MGDGGNHGSA